MPIIIIIIICALKLFIGTYFCDEQNQFGNFARNIEYETK